MLLYDKKEKSLDVYDFSASKDNLIYYRMTQMEKIPKTERFFVAETHTDPYGDSPLFEEYTGKVFNDRLLLASYADNDSEERKNNAYRRYHVLKNDRIIEKKKDILLNSFIYG